MLKVRIKAAKEGEKVSKDGMLPLPAPDPSVWEMMLDSRVTKTCDCEGDCDCPAMTLRELFQLADDMTGIPAIAGGRGADTTATEVSMSLFRANKEFAQARANIVSHAIQPMLKRQYQLLIHEFIWAAIYRAWTAKTIQPVSTKAYPYTQMWWDWAKGENDLSDDK